MQQKWNMCGHALIKLLHLGNWMEDVSIHSLDVWNINFCQLSRLCECIPMIIISTFRYACDHVNDS